MGRNENIAASFDRSMRLIEIGASYSPIVPKAAGWQTTVVDHAEKAELVRKYPDHPALIEEVDIVWQGGALADAFPSEAHGTYDGLIASHVIEHIPDPIGFLQSAAVLLKPDGMVFLAVPDRRVCFDFFQPLSTTGEWLDARGQSRHSLGALYDHAAYYALRGGEGAWIRGSTPAPFALVHPFDAVKPIIQKPPAAEYEDAHTWRFTPARFRLMLLELNLLGQIPWMIERLEIAPAVEFHVWMKLGSIDIDLPVDQRRLDLLQESVMETQEQIAELTAEPTPASSQPTISAVIPLYNGARFIREALESIFAQTLPPNEIIVVDDGSTDDGASVVQQMATLHPITLLHKANGGQSSARNFGIAHSTGDLIALLDQDDAWYPQHLEKLIEPFLDPPIGRPLGWVYSDLDEINTEGSMVQHCFLQSLGTTHPKTNIFECLREDMFVLPSASLISRAAFDAVTGFDPSLSGYEDDDLFLRMFHAGYANVFLKLPLSKWRIYPESSSYTFRMRRSRNVYAKKLFENFPDDPQRARFIRRDLLIPRFYGLAVAEFLKALKTGRDAEIMETKDELLFLVRQMPGRRKRVMEQILSRINSPDTAKRAFAMRGYLRPLARRVV